MTTDTFDTVHTSQAPVLTQAFGLVGVDLNETFIDSDDNYLQARDGQFILNSFNEKIPRELPVVGTMIALPNQVEVTRLGTVLNMLTILTHDSHIPGKNPTVVTSFDGIEPNTWVTLDEAAKWTRKNNPIKPNAGFGINQYRTWLEMIPAHGAMIWNGHANPYSPLYGIHKSILRVARYNPNLQVVHKGEQRSQLIPGFAPESYSADEMSTGESLGLYEFLISRGITDAIIYGNCGDFCAGETALSLARKGLHVWFVVDAQGSVKVPKYAGTEFTSEQLMVAALMNHPNVRLIATAALLEANMVA